jgi:hypothetical protein
MSFSQKGKHHNRTIDRIKMACRLEVGNFGMSDADIARHIGMSQTSYSILKRTQAYQSLKTQFLTGVLSTLDADIVENIPIQRKILSTGVPVALENLLALASQKVDKKLQFEASKEILDRHGAHAKVSRIGAPTIEQGVGNSKDADIANEVISAALKQSTTAPIDVLNSTIDSPPITETKQ